MSIQHSYRRTWEGSGGIPTLDNCDPLNPRQAFLPFLVGLQVGAPVIPGIEFLEATSEHLVECLGIPLDAKGRLLEPIGASLDWERRRKYIPPMTVLDPRKAAGAWVTMDEPDPVGKSAAQIFHDLPHAEKVALAEEVDKSRGEMQANVPTHVKVRDLATQINMTQADTVKVLEGWGVTAKVGGMVDWPSAKRLMLHMMRKPK